MLRRFCFALLLLLISPRVFAQTSSATNPFLRIRATVPQRMAALAGDMLESCMDDFSEQLHDLINAKTCKGITTENRAGVAAALLESILPLAVEKKEFYLASVARMGVAVGNYGTTDDRRRFDELLGSFPENNVSFDLLVRGAAAGWIIRNTTDIAPQPRAPLMAPPDALERPPSALPLVPAAFTDAWRDYRALSWLLYAPARRSRRAEGPATRLELTAALRDAVRGRNVDLAAAVGPYDWLLLRDTANDGFRSRRNLALAVDFIGRKEYGPALAAIIPLLFVGYEQVHTLETRENPLLLPAQRLASALGLSLPRLLAGAALEQTFAAFAPMSAVDAQELAELLIELDKGRAWSALHGAPSYFIVLGSFLPHECAQGKAPFTFEEFVSRRKQVSDDLRRRIEEIFVRRLTDPADVDEAARGLRSVCSPALRAPLETAATSSLAAQDAVRSYPAKTPARPRSLVDDDPEPEHSNAAVF